MRATLFAPESSFIKDTPLPTHQKYERTIYFGVGLHGLAILAFLGGTFWEWTAVFITIGLGISFFFYERFLLIRPIALVIISWLIVLSTGGATSFLQLWFFITVPLYSFILERPYGLIFPTIIALGFFLFVFITPSQIPVIVLLARTALHFALGLLSFTMGSAYRQTIRQNAEAHRALKLSTEQFQLAAEVANLTYWYWDIVQDRVTRVEMGEALLGNHSGENRPTIEGFFANVHPEDLEAVKTAVYESVAQKRPYHHEFRLVDKNGRTRWIMAHGQVHTNDIGEPVMLVGLSQDITESKMVSATIEQQANLLKIVSDAIIATDENFIVRSWNSAAEALYGWQAEEIIGKSLGEVVPTSYVNHGRDAVLSQFRDKGLWKGEVIQTGKSGEKLHILSSVTAIRGENGILIGAVAVNRDITERKRIEKALYESEELYRTLVETVPMAVTVINEKLEAIFANEAAATMFGAASPKELLGPPKWKIIPEQTAPLMQERAARIQSGQATVPQTYRILRLDGQEIVIEARSIPVQFRGTSANLAVAVDVTERTHYEEKLHLNTQQLARAHEIAQIATWQWDLGTDTVTWSNEMYRLFGVEPGSIIPSLDSNSSFVHPADRGLLPDARSSIKQKGYVMPIEFRIIRGDGEERLIWADGEVTLDENGRPQTMLGILQDITERKQADAAIKRNQTHLQMAQASAGMGSWEYNPKTEAIYWSDEMYQIFNHDPQMAPLTPEEYRSNIHPQYVDTVMDTITKAFAQGEAATIEFITLQEKGPNKYLRGSFQPIFSDRGEYVLMVGTVIDMTDRHKIEIDLQKEAQRNLLILNTMQDGYILSDNEGKLLDVNKAYCRMIGYSREALLQMQIQQLDGQTNLKDLQERLDAMLKTGHAHFETKHRRQDGRIIDLEVSGSFLESDTGPIVASFVRDITDRKQAEAEIMQRNLELSSLLQISQQVSQLLNLQDLLDAILTAVVETTPNAEAASIWFYDENQDRLSPRAWINHNDAEMSSLILSPDTSMVGQIYRQKKPLIFQDTQVESSFKALNVAKLDSVRSVMGVPFVMQNNVVMILFADCYSQANAFSNDDLRWLQSLTGQVAVMVQNARLFTAEKQARETAEILQNANLALTETLNLDTILHNLLIKLEMLIPYDTANVMLRTAEHVVKVVAQRGYPVATNGQEPTDSTFDPYQNWSMNQVIIHQNSLIIANTHETPEWDIRQGAEHVMSWLGVPLIAEGAVIGLYSIDKSEPNYFTQAHLHLAEALSAQAAVAIRNAQLLQELHNSQEELHALTVYLQSAREDERKRISHEIHDQFGQLLTAIKMNLAWLNKQFREEDQHLKDKINSISALSDEAIAVARRVARELRPGLLDDLGLAAALESHLQEFTRHTNVHTSLDIDSSLDIDQTELAVTIFRIVQEALTNVARHAQATQVQVLIKLESQGLKLSIIDNGRGITQVQKTGKKSLGLLGIRERARGWQGEVQIEGQYNLGTSIIVLIPQKSIRDLYT